jgi:hypothetical protein
MAQKLYNTKFVVANMIKIVAHDNQLHPSCIMTRFLVVIRCVTIEEDVRMLQKLRKNIEPNVHLYPVQVSNDLIEEGNTWTQIKNMIRLDESLNEEQHKQLWDLLEEF